MAHFKDIVTDDQYRAACNHLNQINDRLDWYTERFGPTQPRFQRMAYNEAKAELSAKIAAYEAKCPKGIARVF